MELELEGRMFRPGGCAPPPQPAIHDCCLWAAGSKTKQCNFGSQQYAGCFLLVARKVWYWHFCYVICIKLRPQKTPCMINMMFMSKIQQKDLTLADKNVWMTKTRGWKKGISINNFTDFQPKNIQVWDKYFGNANCPLLQHCPKYPRQSKRLLANGNVCKWRQSLLCPTTMCRQIFMFTYISYCRQLW